MLCAMSGKTRYCEAYDVWMSVLWSQTQLLYPVSDVRPKDTANCRYKQILKRIIILIMQATRHEASVLYEHIRMVCNC